MSVSYPISNSSISYPTVTPSGYPTVTPSVSKPANVTVGPTVTPTAYGAAGRNAMLPIGIVELMAVMVAMAML